MSMSPLITAAELKQRLGSDTAVIDCRFSLADPALGYRQYRDGHITGAYYFSLDRDLSAPPAEHGGRHPLPDTDTLVAKLNAAGINDHSLVVAYDDSHFSFAARLWWLLRYLGHDNVALLDGGYRAWVTAGYPLDRREPAPRSGRFQARPQRQWTADVKQVQSAIGDQATLLLDSREPARYRGEQEPIDPVAGHIPGALNFPWCEASDADGFALGIDAQRARWQALPPHRELIVYCGSGVSACANLLSLHLAGHRARLYPGSWSDWCSYAELPVAGAGA